MKVKLNHRLETVASCVEENTNVIDIGCDHALLDIYLIQNNKCNYIIASDNKIGPVNQATANVKKYNIDRIKIKLGNGVETIEDNIDTIIISGMGGLNIVGILKYHTNLYKQVDTLILSPNSDAEILRKEISNLGFHITNEKLVKENNIVYQVMVFKRGKKYYTRAELLFGPILINNKSELFMEYIKNNKQAKETLLKILPKKYYRKRFRLKKDIKLINKLLDI